MSVFPLSSFRNRIVNIIKIVRFLWMELFRKKGIGSGSFKVITLNWKAISVLVTGYILL
jgi:hypothetical protein